MQFDRHNVVRWNHSRNLMTVTLMRGGASATTAPEVPSAAGEETVWDTFVGYFRTFLRLNPLRRQLHCYYFMRFMEIRFIPKQYAQSTMHALLLKLIIGLLVNNRMLAAFSSFVRVPTRVKTSTFLKLGSVSRNVLSLSAKFWMRVRRLE